MLRQPVRHGGDLNHLEPFAAFRHVKIDKLTRNCTTTVRPMARSAASTAGAATSATCRSVRRAVTRSTATANSPVSADVKWAMPVNYAMCALLFPDAATAAVLRASSVNATKDGKDSSATNVSSPLPSTVDISSNLKIPCIRTFLPT